MVQETCTTPPRRNFRRIGPLRFSPSLISVIAAASAALIFTPIRSQQPIRAEAGAPIAPSFEVASIKPAKPDATGRDWDSDSDRVEIKNYTLRDLIAAAYGLKSNLQVLGGPGWLDKLGFDISAVIDEPELARLKPLSADDGRRERQIMIQSLLADRFDLKVTVGRKTLPIYALVVAKHGPKLAPADANGKSGSFSVHNSHMEATGVSLEKLAEHLSRTQECDRVVLDRTGLAGIYTFTLDWTSDRGNGIPPGSQFPGLFTALKDQLGLELKSENGLVDVVTVNSASQPTFD